MRSLTEQLGDLGRHVVSAIVIAVGLRLVDAGLGLLEAVDTTKPDDELARARAKRGRR